jgi:HEAT repeat protein
MICPSLRRAIDPVDEIKILIADLISGEDQTAEAALQNLIQLGEPALESLLQLLSSMDPDHRWWAVRGLTYFNNASASESLVLALCDPDPSVQYCAALGLRTSPSLHAIPNLIKALESEDRLMARLAGDALSVIGLDAIPALKDSMQSLNPVTRGEAARALAKMELPEVIPILYSALEDPSPIVQYWLDEGLDRLGTGMVFFKP